MDQSDLSPLVKMGKISEMRIYCKQALDLLGNEEIVF